jgi:hypothetical protein
MSASPGKHRACMHEGARAYAVLFFMLQVVALLRTLMVKGTRISLSTRHQC